MKISGHVDLCGPELIEGWLYCDAWEGEPIGLQVYVGERLLGECVADRFRPDLQEAGFGDGRCGFSFVVSAIADIPDFGATKLRMIGTPVYMLPDEFTTVQGVAMTDRAREEVDMKPNQNEPGSSKAANVELKPRLGYRRNEVIRA